MKTQYHHNTSARGQGWRKAAVTLVSAVLGSGLFAPAALAWNHTNVPLFWASGATPNVMMLVDDSGSMHHITYSKSYGDYIQANGATATSFEGTVNDDSSDTKDTIWHFCSSMTSGSAALTTSAQGVNRCTNTTSIPSAFSVQTPVVPTSGSFPVDSTSGNGVSSDKGYIFSEYGNPQTERPNVNDDPILCDVSYLNTAGSGAGRGFKRILAGSGTLSANVGVMVSSRSGSSQSTALNACVRLKEVNTAVSPRKDSGTACVTTDETDDATSLVTVSPRCPSAIDGHTTYESGYFMYLLTMNVLSSQVSTGIPAADNGKNVLVNFSNTYSTTVTATGVADTIVDNPNFPNEVTATITNPADKRIIPNLNRIETARLASRQVYNDNKVDMRIGLARFNGGSGANINTQGVKIGASDATMQNGLTLIRAEDSTPLTESLYEVIRYFAGKVPEYTVNGTSAFTSPIQYRCQKNYTVLLTDGDPTSDAHRAVCGNSSSTIPGKIGDFANWPSTTTMNYDGVADACIGNEEVVLDDMAQWAFDQDLRGTSSNTPSGVCPVGVATPAAGFDCSGKSWDDPTGTDATNPSLGKFQKQDMTTYTVAFGLNNNVLAETPELKATTTLAPSSISVAANTITFAANHNLVNDDSVRYRRADVTSGTMVGGLQDVTEYFVKKVSNTVIQLATTKGGAAIDLTSQGTGNFVLSEMNTPRTDDHRRSRVAGKSYVAMTASEVSDSLTSAFTEISAMSSSAASVAVSGDMLGAGSLVYQPKFETQYWSGDILALQFNLDGTINTTTPVWKASTTTTAATRGTLLTWNGSSGTALTYANLTTAQKADINNDANVVTWLSGTDVPGYRTRANGIIGDIIDSAPIHLSTQDFRYDEISDPCTANGAGTAYVSGSGCTGAKLYKNYVENTKASVTPMLYVGANDGFVHGFRADNGQERLAYLPTGVFTDWDDADDDGVVDGGETVEKKLYNLTRPAYKHRFFINATPAYGDVWNGSAWRTLVVGGLAQGGRSVYALDATDTTFTAADVKWEFSHVNLGYTYSKPVIARLQDGTWAAIFGNGFDSGGDKAQLFVVNALTGALIRKIDTNDGSAANENGISGFQVLVDNNRTVTRVYAGDLRGNIWRFDMSSTAASSWSVSKLFTATDSMGNPQPITGGLRLGNNPKVAGGIMVLFGTGKYFEEGIDNAYSGNPKEDTFYGILDKNGTAVSKNNLVQQSLSELSIGGNTYRQLTQNAVDYNNGDMGWYIDAVVGTDYQGEKMTGQPILYGGRIIWVSRIAQNADRCFSGGIGVLMEADALTGGQITAPVLDTNNDGKIDSSDVNVAGRVFTDGMITDPQIVSDPTSGKDYKVFSTTGGNVMSIGESQPPGEGSDPGRMSWQQLQ